MDTTIRSATVDDAAELAAIYNHYVSNSHCTFETEPVDAEQMAKRIGDTLATPLPWLIAEASPTILGYAYAAPWKARHAYRFTVESTIYLAPSNTQKGIGQELYAALMTAIRATSIHTVIGGIALPNENSIRLHERLGFKKAGQLNEVGYKNERWVDVGYWRLVV